MKDGTLLKSQRNQVFEVIVNHSMKPADFQWWDFPSGRTAALRVVKVMHVPTKFFYTFDLHHGLHFAEFSPGRETQAETAFPGSWELQLLKVGEWLTYLRRELDEPDLWESVMGERELMAAVVLDEEIDTPFTGQELERIRLSLDEIKRYLLSVGVVSAEYRDALVRRLDYLAEASRRQGRLSWVQMAVGTMVGLAVQYGISGSMVREILRMLGAGIHGLFSSLQAPP